jgi:hypothetical protein
MQLRSLHDRAIRIRWRWPVCRERRLPSFIDERALDDTNSTEVGTGLSAGNGTWLPAPVVILWLHFAPFALVGEDTVRVWAKLYDRVISQWWLEAYPTTISAVSFGCGLSDFDCGRAKLPARVFAVRLPIHSHSAKRFRTACSLGEARKQARCHWLASADPDTRS